jgi:hypothetical protein
MIPANPRRETEMGGKDWKTELRGIFESIRILEKSKHETLVHFEQFCEFIVEPAFESLAEEIAEYGVKLRVQKTKGRDIRLNLSFPRGKEDQFHYKLVLPKNSVELRLGLVIKGRKTPKADLKTKDGEFMPGLSPAEILKLTKDDVILDVLEHYRDFSFEALTAPD